MKLTKIFFLLSLCFTVLLTSCRKEELSEEIKIENEITPETKSSNKLVQNVEVEASTSNEDGLDLCCFSINLPFGLVVDGVEVTINSAEEFEAAASSGEFIDFAYPLAITYPDGTADDIADGVELGEAFASCVPDGGWGTDQFPAYLICDLNSCYQLIYPVNLVDGDGNTYTATSEEEFIELIVEQPELYFEFPIALTDEDGNTITAEDEEDLFELLASCDTVYDPPGPDTIIFEGFFGCYDLAYPANVIDLDGNTITVNNADEFFNLLLNGNFTDFAYPLTLIGEDGETITVNNHEELCAAVEECYDIPGGGGGGGPDPNFGLDAFGFIGESSLFGGDCYELVYPFTVVNADGSSTMSIADATAAEGLLTNPNDFYFIELPADIKVIDSGETKTINTVEDFFLTLEDCW